MPATASFLITNPLSEEKLYLGNLDAKRDWGFAGDYVEAMWLMLQQDEPDDFVIATGETHSVREFVELAFGEVGIEIEWQGTGVDEVEVDILIGDPTKAKEKLGWKAKIELRELVKMMVEGDAA